MGCSSCKTSGVCLFSSNDFENAVTQKTRENMVPISCTPFLSRISFVLLVFSCLKIVLFAFIVAYNEKGDTMLLRPGTCAIVF
jgi:hypothetical protein